MLEYNPQLPTHATRRGTWFDICGYCDGLESLMARNLYAVSGMSREKLSAGEVGYNRSTEGDTLRTCSNWVRDVFDVGTDNKLAGFGEDACSHAKLGVGTYE